ncbi:MAG: hypothetical protein ACOX5Z_06145 [Desulfobulbus sp.]|jgi:hypothetical protein
MPGSDQAVSSGGGDADLVALKLLVPPDLYRAFQRCVWIQIHETDRTQLDLMEEMVRDFLVKHTC